MKPIILLVGKSGSGKNYLASAFQLNALPSFTTRLKRIKESQGLEHQFVSMELWNRIYSKQENIVAKTFFDGNWYWVTSEQIANPFYDVYVIDPTGIRYFIKNFDYKIMRKYHIVYVEASLFTRIRNMRKRKDSWKNIIKRLLNDRKEFRGFKNDKSIQKIIVRV